MKTNLSRHVLAGSTMLALAAAASASQSMPRSIVQIRAETNPAAVLAELQQAWAAFQTSQTQAAATRDAVDVERTARIDASIVELQGALDGVAEQIAAARLNGNGAPGTTAEQRAYAQSFDGFFRQGDASATSALRELAIAAAMTTQDDTQGGYLVPVEMEAAIDRVLGTVSVMRQLAQIQQISSGEYKKQVSLGGAGAGWVGETDSRAETGTPTLAELTFTPGQIFAKPKASQDLLDDARVNLEEWLAGEVDISFAEQEGAAFINGNGIKKPRGILDHDTVADASYAWGKLGFVASGGATSITSDALINLIYAPKTGYRSNARFLMNRKTVSEVRKLKDGQGNYIWQPSLQVGQPASLSGYPVAEDDNMPDIAAGSFSIAFGDFRRGYLIVDRMGIRVLRDPFSAKPFVEFYTTKRVGGGVQDYAAIKLLKTTA